MPNGLDLRYKPTYGVTGIAQLLAQKPMMEEQIRASQRQGKQQKFNRFLNTISAVTQLGQLAQSARKQRMEAEAQQFEMDRLSQEDQELSAISEYLANRGRAGVDEGHPMGTIVDTQMTPEQARGAIRHTPELFFPKEKKVPTTPEGSQEISEFATTQFLSSTQGVPPEKIKELQRKNLLPKKILVRDMEAIRKGIETPFTMLLRRMLFGKKLGSGTGAVAGGSVAEEARAWMKENAE